MPPKEKPATAAKTSDAARTDLLVFGVTAVATVAFLVWGVAGTDSLATASQKGLNWLLHNIGWAFVLAASGFVVFALWLAVSRYGNIPLGKDGEEPEFRTVSWVAMMFSAGMGIGLMFYGVSEPLAHYAEPPPGTAKAQTSAALETSMATSLFHWTLHPWAIYAVVGLALAYGAYRKGRRQLISAAFTPLFGERNVNGPIGKMIDILAIFATLFGTAASLGLGAVQIGNGMEQVGWLNKAGTTLLVVIITVLTIAFIVSAVSGVARGIQWLSNINMVLAGVLALFIFVVGPTVFILNLLPTAIGDYFRDLASMAARTEASGASGMQTWLGEWTIFYWAWWISWTPFVGMFIARISRGRTIRQFVGGVILIPSVVSLVWFAILGGTAIHAQRTGADLAHAAGQEAQMFDMLKELPWTGITSVLVMVLVAIFFVSGADAASIVMGSLSQRGVMEPQRLIVVFWGAITGAVAAIMLLVSEDSNGLDGLRRLTILVAAPFTLVMIMLCVSLMKDLRRDPLVQRGEKGIELVELAVIHGHTHYEGDFQLDVSPVRPRRPRKSRE